jgi:hypothetical protein
MRTTRLFRPVAALAACLVLAGCPYSSEHPLGDPATAVLDKALVGAWVTTDPETRETSTVTFLPFNDHELVGVGAEGGSSPGSIMTFRLFVTVIDGQRFLNICEIREDGAQEWYFARYSASADSLSLRLVDDALVGPSPLTTSAELQDFVRRNLSNPRLYGGTESEQPPMTLTRQRT